METVTYSRIPRRNESSRPAASLVAAERAERAKETAEADALAATFRAELAALAAARLAGKSAPPSRELARSWELPPKKRPDRGHIAHPPGGPPSLWTDEDGTPLPAAPAPRRERATSYKP